MALKISTSRHRSDAGNQFPPVELTGAAPASKEAQTLEPVIETKHSGLGIASFTLSIIASLLIFLFIVIAGVLTVTGNMKTAGPDGNPAPSPVAMILGLAFFCIYNIRCDSHCTGHRRINTKKRTKVFSILGILFAVSILIITALLMVVGLMAKAH